MITATSGSVNKTATATVSQVASSVTLSPTNLSFTSLGDAATVVPAVTDALGATMPSPTVTWATSSSSVATVSSVGLVTSVATGTATITATAGSASATAAVTVSDFLVAANGVTLTCSAADVGETGEVGGVTYTKRSQARVDALVDGEDYAPLSTTCTRSATNMTFMFRDATAFNQDIGSWDVSSATNMNSMFYNASLFNQDIGSWDVSSVTIMNSMFRNATAFKQNVSGWCVSLITSEPTRFDSGASSWVLARPVWGTCPS